MQPFELADLIRMNQLVRGRIDIDGFQAWFASLPLERRRALTYQLCEFAYQAGVDNALWDDAFSVSGLHAADPVVRQALVVGRGENPVFRLYDLVVAVPEDDLAIVFPLFVQLFGLAEGRVYRGESPEYCNHWWHRDLLDERVVQDLLNDPRYYMTAIKDDTRIQGG